MKELTNEEIIKYGKYYKRLPIWGIFAISGIGMSVVSLVGTSGGVSLSNSNFLINCVVTFIFPLLPFGYFWGLKKIIGELRDLRKIKEGDYFVIEKNIIGKQVLTRSDSLNDTQLIFSQDDGVWVSRKEGKKFINGDRVYLIYLCGDEEPSGVFNKRYFYYKNSII